MKKFIAILLAVLTVLSAASVMVFAADATTTTTANTVKCDFCDKEFADLAALKTHLDGTFPVKDHTKACPNEGCDYTFTTKVAYDAHAAVCEFKPVEKTDAEKLQEAIADKKYDEVCKIIISMIVSFVKSDEFKKITTKVADLIGKINFDKVFSRTFFRSFLLIRSRTLFLLNNLT